MKWLIIDRKQLMMIISASLALLMGIIASAVAFASSDRRVPIYCVEQSEKKIAISFDAAWGNDDTGKLIEILKEYDVPATFFVVGSWVDKYPESVKQLSDAGHMVQNHSDTHPHMTKLSTEQMCEEINSCNKKIEKITGKTPILFRAPYGDYSNGVLDAVDSMKMFTIQWNVDSLDWMEKSTAESICKRVTEKVCPGSIVLFHNDADYTPDALPSILKCLKDDGYKFVFISDLIYKENYEIDHAGKQCPMSSSSSSVDNS